MATLQAVRVWYSPANGLGGELFGGAAECVTVDSQTGKDVRYTVALNQEEVLALMAAAEPLVAKATDRMLRLLTV